jgi:hypothetical protein
MPETEKKYTLPKLREGDHESVAAANFGAMIQLTAVLILYWITGTLYPIIFLLLGMDFYQFSMGIYYWYEGE